MTAIQLKTSLHSIVDSIEDKTLLKKAYEMIVKLASKENAELWNSLTKEEKSAIEEGISQSEKGLGIPHKTVMKEVHAKYKIKH